MLLPHSDVDELLTMCIVDKICEYSLLSLKLMMAYVT